MGLLASAFFVPLFGVALYWIMSVYDVVEWDIRTALVLVVLGAGAHTWGFWVGQADGQKLASRW